MKKMTKTFWLMKDKGIKYITKDKVDKITSLTPFLTGTLNSLIFAHCGQMRGFKNGMSKKVIVTIES